MAGLLDADLSIDEDRGTIPYVAHPCDAIDAKGLVHVPQALGLGYQIARDYIDEHAVPA